jgi:hypothetical protein
VEGDDVRQGRVAGHAVSRGQVMAGLLEPFAGKVRAGVL